MREEAEEEEEEEEDGGHLHSAAATVATVLLYEGVRRFNPGLALISLGQWSGQRSRC